MLSRRVLFPLALASAVGGPATYFSAGKLTSGLGMGEGTTHDAVLASVEQYSQTAKQAAPPAPLGSLDLVPIEEALQFQATPQWVMGRWSRVSTQTAELDLQGYRVTLISGTKPGDVAGALTYYFDHDGHLQRLTFRGTTGDPAHLAQLVTQNYGLRRVVGATPGELLFQQAWGGKTDGELKLTPAEVLREDLPQSRYAVELTLNRPRSMW